MKFDIQKQLSATVAGIRFGPVRVVALLLAAFLLFNVLDHYASAGHPLWGEFSDAAAAMRGPEEKLGEYTFAIVGAEFQDWPADSVSRQDAMMLTVRVSSPPFLGRIDPDAFNGHLTVVGPDGTGHSVNKVVITPAQQAPQVIAGAYQARWRPFYREFNVYLYTNDWEQGDRLRLDFDFEQGSFSLSADIMQRVVKS